MIGLVYDNPNPYHIIGVQNGVLAACRETGFGLQIHPCDSSSPLLADELADWVQRSRLAGLVLTAPMSERRDLIQALTARGIKLVRIIAATEDPADGACVFVDDREAAYEITEHLIQLGHQRIDVACACHVADVFGGEEHFHELCRELVDLGDGGLNPRHRSVAEVLQPIGDSHLLAQRRDDTFEIWAHSGVRCRREPFLRPCELEAQ